MACSPIRRWGSRCSSTATSRRRAPRRISCKRLYAAFYAVGASLAEINPLVTTREGAVAALDAKIVVDDNELDRHPEIAALRDASAEAPSEVAARGAGLTFIKLDGAVGCCVNGAGLAMATMDLVKYYGGEAGQLPRHRRELEPSKSGHGPPDHHGGSERSRHSVQHLRGITAATTWRTASFRPRASFRSRCRSSSAHRHQRGACVQILTQAGFPALTDMDEAVKQAVAKAKAA